MFIPYRVGAALVSGLVFGFGLSLSGMLDPARVRGFLNIAGTWDPSLAFVLGGAVGVAALGFQLVQRMRRPVFDNEFHLSPKTPVDARLVGGSALFGVGWGLAGFCPGPAVASLVIGWTPLFVFGGAMIAGMIAYDRLLPRLTA